MLLVIDTHAILWDAFAPSRLPLRVRRAIQAADESHSLCWADISVWEIAMLGERGRISLPPPHETTIADLIASRSVRILPITPAIAVRAQQLYALRGDPADSLIAATAIEHGATLVTADARISSLPGVRVLW